MPRVHTQAVLRLLLQTGNDIRRCPVCGQGRMELVKTYIYHENHALVKFVYMFEKYINKDIKRRCNKWCDDFNYANTALQSLTKKKEKFVPVAEEEMIEL